MTAATFHCVSQFCSAAGDFRIVGLFTKANEAGKFAANLPLLDSPAYKGDRPAVVVEMTMAAIVEDLLKDRLGRLHGVLTRLESVVSADVEGPA